MWSSKKKFISKSIGFEKIRKKTLLKFWKKIDKKYQGISNSIRNSVTISLEK